MTESDDQGQKARPRMAIIGGGSSGLITLKMALDFLSGWDIVCYEKTDSITGCWGNPYPGFVSTSTRYTTQFACFPVCDATVNPDGGASREEFFRNDDYGQYLESFAEHFGLRQFIELNTTVENFTRNSSGDWELSVNGTSERFDAVVICTGLAASPKPIECDVPQLSVAELNSSNGLANVTNRRVVVIGGGESAVDYANRLANEDLNNEVYLSLKSGVRVSPRYHPIRGVPSDFLRNRLMLSVHQDIRNWIGHGFVKSRIKYERLFERFFPSRRAKASQTTSLDQDVDVANLRRQWALKLTMEAKDDLFNMFHNKSDDFLEAVGRQRIQIIGPAIDSNFAHYFAFGSESDATIEVQPDLIVPAIGYQSTLGRLTNSSVRLTDFYLGCCHVEIPNLFLVGFARPIIGNIPTISEMQARYVCGLIAGRFPRPAGIESLHQGDQAAINKDYPKLNHESVYPVEMIPYCDRLARLMGMEIGPRFFDSISSWWQSRLAPATTMHYFCDEETIRENCESAPVYMPVSLIGFVLLMKPVDWVYRLFRWPFTN